MVLPYWLCAITSTIVSAFAIGLAGSLVEPYLVAGIVVRFLAIPIAAFNALLIHGSVVGATKRDSTKPLSKGAKKQQRILWIILGLTAIISSIVGLLIGASVLGKLV